MTHVLGNKGYNIDGGYDAVVYGNIPGGGMSRSASLSINLMLVTYEPGCGTAGSCAGLSHACAAV